MCIVHVQAWRTSIRIVLLLWLRIALFEQLCCGTQMDGSSLLLVRVARLGYIAIFRPFNRSRNGFLCAVLWNLILRS